MNNKVFEYKGKFYPEYLRKGNAIKFILPISQFFLEGCKSVVDVGGTKEWHYPKSDYINTENKNQYHAMNLPNKIYDGLISSHTLEHLKDPFTALKHWSEHLKKGSPMLIYLPSVKQRYWAVDCPKHLHFLTPEIIEYWMDDLGFEKIIKTEQDAYYSFMVVGWKK